VSSALEAAGFRGVCLDGDLIELSYSSPSALLEDLALFGERGALAQETRPSRDVLTAALAMLMPLYGEMHEETKELRLPLSFNAIWFIGWTPGPLGKTCRYNGFYLFLFFSPSLLGARPKPRGSATRSLKELSQTKQKT
jgi:hypothetical protein